MLVLVGVRVGGSDKRGVKGNTRDAARDRDLDAGAFGARQEAHGIERPVVLLPVYARDGVAHQ